MNTASTHHTSSTSHTQPLQREDALNLQKVTLRRALRAARDSLSAEEHVALSSAAATKLLEYAPFQTAKCILLTKAFGSEIDMAAIVKHALAAGKHVAMPRVVANTGSMALHLIDIGTVFVKSAVGIDEPPAFTPEIAASEIDFVIVPGLAFDSRGNRLGYGGGYFDRLLAAHPSAHRAAVAFDLQLVEVVPVATHDVKLDALFTADKELHFTR
jgi:5-formyltetrahydrofolate cyclo-ligase